MKTEIEWIPVSEKLPRLEDDVLVTVRNKETGDGAVWNGVRYKNGWAIASCCDYIELYDADSNMDIIAWAHLPEPYKFDVVDLECAHWNDTGSKVFCSRCGASNKEYKSPYCPHCGAKMEGVD